MFGVFRSKFDHFLPNLVLKGLLSFGDFTCLEAVLSGDLLVDFSLKWWGVDPLIDYS